LATYCFRKAKFCGVPSRAIVKVGCVVHKIKVSEHWAIGYILATESAS
jgi:hypothetical protein